MHKPILYYTLLCPAARACMITSKLIGLDLEIRIIDCSKNEQFSEEFIKINPLHQIPVLIDENEPYYDSHAIMAYIVSKYAKTDSLYPKDLSKRARVDQRLHFESGVLFPIIKDFVNRFIHYGETEYHPRTIQNCHTAYGQLDKFLENQDYMVGTELTIADISINTTVISLDLFVSIEKEKYPKISAWMERLKSLPDYEDVNAEGARLLAIRINSCMFENRSKVST